MTTHYSTGFVAARNQGMAFATLFRNGCMQVYSGPQPVNADAAPTGHLLARITRNGGSWTAGMPDNGLQFVAAGRYILKEPTQRWYLTGLAEGIAGWFRLLPNTPDPHTHSLTAVRIDGAVTMPPSMGELLMSNSTITPTTSLLVPHWWHGTPPL